MAKRMESIKTSFFMLISSLTQRLTKSMKPCTVFHQDVKCLFTVTQAGNNFRFTSLFQPEIFSLEPLQEYRSTGRLFPFGICSSTLFNRYFRCTTLCITSPGIFVFPSFAPSLLSSAVEIPHRTSPASSRFPGQHRSARGPGSSLAR
jgi:hypothetical protein